MPARKLNGQWTLAALAEHVSEIVAKESGNVLGPGQQSMVASRLKKRLMDLGGISPQEYYRHLESNYKRESTQLVSMLTTHHTFFFREFSHFEYILKHLDEIVARVKARGDNKIKVLSAACSRGQEVYSLAMLLQKHLEAHPGMSFEIMGTDIDPESVEIAKNGVFAYKEVKTIPQIYLQGNWQRGKGKIAEFAKVKDALKAKCSFGVMNLLRPKDVLGSKKFDLVFCRNVFIYFKTPDIALIVESLKKHIHPGGHLFTGLSESLKEIGVKMNTHAPSVYSFDAAPILTPKPSTPLSTRDASPITSPAVGRRKSIPSPVRMLIVDDSPSVVKLLSKIFSSDPEFKVVGTASNGLEAKEFLKNNSVDAMTLDIHMPEMDGVEYLKQNYNTSHPKVVVVSSASREDTRYAQETIRFGASDFVEKPALNNLGQRAEEIKNKIKMTFLNEGLSVQSKQDSIKRDFVIENPQSKGRVLFGSFSDLKKIKSSLGELRGNQPPVYVFFEGNSNYLDMIKGELGPLFDLKLFGDEPGEQAGKVYLCDYEKDFAQVSKMLGGKKTSISVFGIISKKAQNSIIDFCPGQLLLEDLESMNAEFKEVATDVFPWTSFTHVATEFLAKE